MCIIIDACCAGSLCDSQLPQSKLILEWVRSGGKVVSGGDLQRELAKTKLRGLLLQWSAAGKLFMADPNQISQEVMNLKEVDLKSNDRHVLALARVTNARTVITRDELLMEDLKNRNIVGFRRKIFPMREGKVDDLRIHRGVLRNSECR